jgi:hypothetical protein
MARKMIPHPITERASQRPRILHGLSLTELLSAFLEGVTLLDELVVDCD